MTLRKMRIGAFLCGTGSNMSSWRHPDATADGAINSAHAVTRQTITRLRVRHSASREFVVNRSPLGDSIH